MAESADALDSGSSRGNSVEVQVLLSAPKRNGNFRKEIAVSFWFFSLFTFILSLFSKRNCRFSEEIKREEIREYSRFHPRYIAFTILPQAMRSPAFPAGCDVKSSGLRCRMTLLPMISRSRKPSQSTALNALPRALLKTGGRSPACAGCGQSFGL